PRRSIPIRAECESPTGRTVALGPATQKGNLKNDQNRYTKTGSESSSLKTAWEKSALKNSI
ncbi:hypothetical protein J2P12_07995, partial [Candidatus Bathyarchaeota archaeon]|nr:hypothetical protein [Candidatus Bathyarchaeota archaeon]